MSLDIRCPEHLAEARAHADTLGEHAEHARQTLEKGLEYLSNYRGGGCVAVLTKDFAPHSFEFAVCAPAGKLLFNGGLIYLGPGSPGDGSFPVLSVSLSTDTRPRWEIHT